MNKIQSALIILILLSCTGKETVSNPADDFLPGAKLAELKNKKLSEISGLAASVRNPKLLWAHNDSGNDPEIYLLDENLEIKLTVKLSGVENRDWEDITAGPGPDPEKSYIYIADIGDNDAQYEYKFIYRLEEPTWNGEEDETINISSFDKITFKLPDEKKDTETLMIDPKTKNLYVVSKREEPVYLYELKYPQSTEAQTVATELFPLPFTQIVGGDLSANGEEILMKNYHHIFYWKTSSTKPFTEVLKEVPEEVPYETEPQGESITWARDGSGFYTLSEETKNQRSYLYFYKRK